MLITTLTTADQILRATICAAYKELEKYDLRTEIGATWRVRNGALVRIEFYVRQYVHKQEGDATSPFLRHSYLLDLPALDNNQALGYQWKTSLFGDGDQAEHFTSMRLLLEGLEADFGSHRALKLQTLQEVISN